MPRTVVVTWSVFGTAHLKENHMLTNDHTTTAILAGKLTSDNLGHIVEFSWVDPKASAIYCEVTGMLVQVNHIAASWVELSLRATPDKALMRSFRVRATDEVALHRDV